MKAASDLSCLLKVYRKRPTRESLHKLFVVRRYLEDPRLCLFFVSFSFAETVRLRFVLLGLGQGYRQRLPAQTEGSAVGKPGSQTYGASLTGPPFVLLSRRPSRELCLDSTISPKNMSSSRMASRALRVNVLRHASTKAAASAVRPNVASRRGLSVTAAALRDATKLTSNSPRPHYEKIRGQQKVFATAEEAVADIRKFLLDRP